MTRQLGVAYLEHVDLDNEQTPTVDDRVRVRDEGSDLWDAVVGDREDAVRLVYM